MVQSSRPATQAHKKLSRPPVVTIMGHIDHGKTTLLDALRQTNLAARESGGITQHINACQLKHQNRTLTFIDTPGHAAFAAMRSRGAKITDLVILVIDSVEGVKAQTLECLDHIKAARAPFIIALNKIDLASASPAKVKKQLAENKIITEDLGGDIVVVEISAKQKTGLDQLLEMTFLLADMQKLTVKPNAPFRAVVIESKLSPRQGPLATLIIQAGILKLTDQLQADSTAAKVKALFDYQGRKITQALPGQPVLVLGFKQLPPVGAIVTQLLDVSELNNSNQISTPLQSESINNKPQLKIILKADTQGTLEAITQNLPQGVLVVSQGVGQVTDSDIILAQSTQSQIIAFRVKLVSTAKKLADIEKITINSYQLIHQLLEELVKASKKKLDPVPAEQVLGQAKIIAQFTIKEDRIAGCHVTQGKLTQGDKVHLVRNQKTIADSKINSLQQNKNSVNQIKKGQDCGLILSPPVNFKLKDILTAFKPIS